MKSYPCQEFFLYGTDFFGNLVKYIKHTEFGTKRDGFGIDKYRKYVDMMQKFVNIKTEDKKKGECILKIKLKTDFWTFKDYCLDIGEQKLDFRPSDIKNKRFSLAFDTVISFNVMKSSNGCTEFILETADGIFEGKFYEKDDHEKLLKAFCGFTDRYELTVSGF